jgi:hypothetical protein
MESDCFKPYFTELYESTLHPRAIHHPGRQGPQLPIVETALAMSEMHGDRKYSAFNINISNLNEVDHYALCLYYLRVTNKTSRDVIFRDRQMSDAAIEARLWQAILRATSNCSKWRSKNRNSQHITEEAPVTLSIFTDTPSRQNFSTTSELTPPKISTASHDTTPISSGKQQLDVAKSWRALPLSTQM